MTGARGNTCVACGRVADPATDGDPPLWWSAEVVRHGDERAVRWLCVECTRRDVRSIEAKLEREWW